MTTILTWILGALKIIIVLGTLITIHELGHFTVAKLCNVKVNKFAIGFGPKIFTKTSGETEYTLRIIPFGGFVQMEGEEASSDDERAFNKKNVWQRIAIVAAGATVNIMFALIIYFFIALSSNKYVSTKVMDISDGPLYEAGIKAGDEIEKVNGEKVLTLREIESIIENAKSDEFTFDVIRNNQKLSFNVKIPYETRGYMGIAFGDEKDVLYIYANSPAYEAGIQVGDIITSVNDIRCENTIDVVTNIRNIHEGKITLDVLRSGDFITINGETISKTNRYYSLSCDVIEPTFGSNIIYALDETGYYFSATIEGIFGFFSGTETENVEIVGPVGVAKQISSTNGLSEFFYLMSAISLSLGIFNLFPIPALDGGRILILFIEAIRRKPMKESLEQGIILAGFIAIILMSLVITISDVIKIF